MSKEESLTYRAAGVDIDAGNALIERIKPAVKRTHNHRVVNQLGGFAALYDAPFQDYAKPLLVSATDGVGTKLKLAQQVKHYAGLGHDLVAMCVNDLITLGAKPLFFLDYYACGQLSVDAASEVIKSIVDGCCLADCALVGGETAEMPGLYQHDDFDLAGFCVGIVDKDKIIDGAAITPGDQLIGIASSGPHANGYSLIRHIIESKQIDLSQTLDGLSLSEHLVKPTKIYAKTILSLLQTVEPHGIAHITGGGILENLPRILPKHCQANIQRNAWPTPPIFQWLQEQGNINDEDMLRTFNCGLGLIIVVKPDELDTSLRLLTELNETAYHIGGIESRQPDTPALRFTHV